MLFRAEILGRVPHGMTHNDVYATLLSVTQDATIVESSTKRRLSGGMISVVFTFHALNHNEAAKTMLLASRAPLNFSADVFNLREVK